MAAQKSTQQLGKDLTTGPITPILLGYAVPIILSTAVQQLYSMVDLMIIGKFVGSVGTVAVSTGGEMSDLMTPVATAVAMGGQILIAQLAGSRQWERVKTSVQTMITLCLAFSIVITLAVLILHRPILSALNCPEEAFDEAAQYLIITTIGMPFVFGYNAICAALRGMGESKRPLIFILIAATINIFLDLLLVVVIPLEAAGTAIATVMSQIGAFAASFYYFYRMREAVGFELSPRYLRIHTRDAAVILRLSIPQLIRTFCVQGSMLWIKSGVNAYGLIVSSTYSVGNKIEKFVQLFITGIDQAGGTVLGQNIGAGRHDRVQATMGRMVVFSLAFAVIGAVLFLVFPSQLYSIFTNDEEVIAYGATFLRIIAVGCFVMALASPMKAIVTGAGEALLSLILGVLDGVMRIVVALIALYVFQLGAESYFWGSAFCMAVPGIISAVYYFSGKWKTKRLVDE